jgi:hypothetical protein
MRRAFLLILVFLFCLSSPDFMSAANAQKDAVAVANVEAAMAAMGGDAGWAAIKDSVITGTITPTKDSWVKPATFVWKTSGTEFRYETTRDSETQIFASGHGKPAVSSKGKVKALFYHMGQGSPPFHFPAVVLSTKLADASYSLIDAGQKNISDKNAFAVQTSSNFSDQVSAITLQTWYIEASTGLPLRVEYRLPEATSITDWQEAATEFSDYKEVGGLLVPFSMTYYLDGVALETISVNAVDFNVGLDPSEFDLLGGGK